MKRRSRLGLCSPRLHAVRPTMAGYVVAMIRKGRAHNVGWRALQAELILGSHSRLIEILTLAGAQWQSYDDLADSTS